MSGSFKCKYDCGNSYPDEAKRTKHEKRCKKRPIKTRGKYNVKKPRSLFSTGTKVRQIYSCKYCTVAKFTSKRMRNQHQRKYHENT